MSSFSPPIITPASMKYTPRFTTPYIFLRSLSGSLLTPYKATKSSSASDLGKSWIDEALFGIAPVFSALKANRRKFYKLCIQEGINYSKRKDRQLITNGIAEAKEVGIDVRYCPKHDLNMIVKGQVHQGFLLDCSPLPFIKLENFENVKKEGNGYPVWLALDEVFDPHNLGAMIRTASFLGVDGIVVSKKNSAPLSPVVSKVSAGALEFVPIHSCQQLPKLLESAQQNDWDVMGSDIVKEAIKFTELQVQGPTILVMGNEANGLRFSVKRACNKFVQIVSLANDDYSSQLDSLNVSVAAGILLSQLTAHKTKV